MTTQKLWAISIPGPDDVYAAPSHKVALFMKEKSDESTREWLAALHKDGKASYLSLDDCLAVIEEIEDPQEHAELLEEFRFEEWGITEEDMNRPEDEAPQIDLFAQGSAK